MGGNKVGNLLLLVAATAWVETALACDPATEVEISGACYYLDGSGGVCDSGYHLGPESVLTPGLFAGKTYKHSVSWSCCIYNADPYQDWGMGDHCNSPGPFTANDPSPGAAGCTQQTGLSPGQLTLCTSALCGNGVVDSGEQCDDGLANGDHGDCCTAECQAVPSGTFCSTGSCDGMGHCIAPPTTTTTTITTTTTTTTAPGPQSGPTDARAAVAYQINPAHTGSSGIHLRFRPKRRWAVDLGGLVAYPLIVDGTVFVTAAVPDVYPMLHALDERTGVERSWSPVLIPGNYTSSRIAYDRGRVFAIVPDGSLAAFDAKTGTMKWSLVLPSPFGGQFTAAPTATDGTLFVGGDGKLYAIAETDGSILWSGFVEAGDDSSPAVSSTGVYVSYVCENVYGFSPLSGVLLWNYHGVNCYGGGGLTPVLYNGRLYARDDVFSNVLLDATTGAPLGNFDAGPPPAFFDGRGFFLSAGGTLEAMDLMSGNSLWTFVGDNELVSAPIVVRRRVFIGSQSGMLYALAAPSGHERWSTNVPASIGASQDAITSLTAGGKTLIVGASNTPCCTSCSCSTVLVAYR